ncbi:MAG: hypothetical protein IJ992_06615, partial [Lentisphaeria bacterium]|nr:hypothetical protein [Lentisphaeria bacterium]
TVLRTLCDRLAYLRNLEKRKDEVRALIDTQGKLDDAVNAAIDAAETVTEVDDIYRPFRPKRRTRASVARERGLSPLADLLMKQEARYTPSLEEAAAAYINEENSITSVEDAFAGARDILAEQISDNAVYRRELRSLTERHGTISSKKLENAAAVYEQYFEYSEPAAKIPSHRILALNRGENEGALSVSVTVERDLILNYLFSEVVTNPKSPAFAHISSAGLMASSRYTPPRRMPPVPEAESVMTSSVTSSSKAPLGRSREGSRSRTIFLEAAAFSTWTKIPWETAK